jgi:hypothetical protein
VVTELRSSIAGIEKRLDDPNSPQAQQLRAEMQELRMRRDVQIHRNRSLMEELHMILRDLTSQDVVKGKTEKERDLHRSLLSRIEHLLASFDREFR